MALLSPWTTKYLLAFSLLFNAFLFLSNFWLLPLYLSSSSSSTITNKQQLPFFIHPTRTNNGVENTATNNIIYGHVHIAKTAGSEINGELANSFERVCGNLGYSYDYYQVNERAKAFASEHDGKIDVIDLQDSVTTLRKLLNNETGYNRGRVPPDIMDEIGYENCDYISVERPSKFWKQQTLYWIPNLELHVPCRDRIQHLMSQCNQLKRTFNCNNPNLEQEVDQCDTWVDDKFTMEFINQPNIDLRCFNPIPVDKYLRYMSQRLQTKKRGPPKHTYVHRESNQPRNKNAECIWKSSSDFQKQVDDILVTRYDYYKFCNQCMGSKQELALEMIH